MGMFSTARTEPEAPALPPTAMPVSPEVAAFIDSTARQREELAYYKAEYATIGNELRLEKEQNRRLEAELADTKTELYRVMRHDVTLTGGLEQVVTLAIRLLEQSKATAYAPPGTGQTKSDLPDEQADKVVGELAKMLAPEPVDA